jgi:hypothetical protein
MRTMTAQRGGRAVHRVEADGVKMYFLEAGTKDAPVVLLTAWISDIVVPQGANTATRGQVSCHCAGSARWFS